ncbi:hypothetical protein LCGC14_2996880 [marine sediment metagenome]|uniref:Uncharacterized protein n=1 Tax=marine sediment metagenome TaxID=412755 RepID=A0A0F8X2M9_9ZZZZ
MKIIEDEIIGELRYLTVEFDQTELLAGHIGVISQGAVRRYFEGKSPDLKVKKCGGLKLDSQRDIVTMRFGVKNPVGVNPIVASITPGYGEPKLLNPGYAELKADKNMLVEMNERHVIKLDELLKSRNHLVDELDETNKQLLAVQERCDALVAAVMQDAQKFSDLLVENEELKVDLEQTKIALFAECPHCVENEELKLELRKYERRLVAFRDVDVSSLLPAQVAEIQKKIEVEDAADLADAKKVLEDSQLVPLTEIDPGPEGEPELVDGKPDCDGDCNSCESHACDIDEAPE